ncbi:MAG: polysaccharide biosynthesis tyrosine autokinase [Capsulimonadaceae bacterium]|nr:polysaccharide biosynthesis tyrosine autokinase [Capsulimonadaceae bacterium]
MEPELEEAGAGLSLTEYWNILRRRRMIIVQTAILIGLTGTIVTFLTRSVYSASARLLVEPPAVGVNNIDPSNPLSSILTLTPVQDIATQVAILQSKPLLDKVQKDAGKSKLIVAQEASTNVIQVSAEANTPETAIKAANSLLENYLDDNVDSGLNEIRSALKFAQDQESAAHKKLMVSEGQIQAFKEKNHLSDVSSNIDALQKRVGDLAEQAELKQASLVSTRAQIAAARKLLANEPPASVVSINSTNPTLQVLQDQIAQLQADRAAMTQKGGFTTTAPQVVAVDARISELRKQLAAQPPMRATLTGAANVVHDQLHGSLAGLIAQEASTVSELRALRAALVQAKAQSVSIPAWQVTYSNLIRDHDAAQTEDKMFSDNVDHLSLRAQAYHATAHILERAQDAELVRPKKAQSIIFSCFIGLFLGICLALLQEMLDDRINSMEETGRALRLPTLGAIPTIAEGSPHLLLEMAGSEPAAESYRSVRTNIHFASVDTALETLLITSPNPGEGKSTTATNIALAMALDGKRVILVDADLRRSTLHKVMGMLAVPGLTDVLLGHSSLEESLQECELASNLHLLPAGSVPPNPSEMLNSRSFANLMQRLTGKADVVVFDSPPVLVGADASILASLVDGVVLVVEAGGTKKQAAKQAVAMLRQARARLIGMAFNKASSSPGYYYYNHYSYYSPGSYGAISDTNSRRSRRTQLPDTADTTKMLVGPAEGDDE